MVAATTMEDAMTDHSRRAVIAGAGAGLVSTVAAGSAQAQVTVDAEMLKKDVTSISIRAPVESAEYWTQKGDVKLYLYRKRTASLPGQAKPVLFLVHGSSNSSRSSYDLSVPGKAEYSMMNVFAQYGF